MIDRKSDYVYDVFETALGWVAVVAGERGVRRMSLPERTPDIAAAAAQVDSLTSHHEPSAVAEIREAVIAFCSGQDVDLTKLPIDTSWSSDFFSRAWRACRSIPVGETRTYAWLATQSGNARAARGAGQAMARNPFPLLVPCHRVIGSDGGLHGFGGGTGLPLKARLLEMESRGAAVAVR
jgi:methylated-DNA-[protein]-cysteine S-methyltransferase